jgi:hypothetical protein
MVVHGPEIFDKGEVAWLMDRIRPERTIVAGVMARTAAEESGLPVEFDGSPPSGILKAIGKPAFLANHGKTKESGRIFGCIVASRLDNRGLVQVECSDRSVMVWDGGDRELADTIAGLTGYLVTICKSSRTVPAGIRQIRGCIPGEPVYVNGIIIGHATEPTVVLRQMGSEIGVVSGLIVKPHGIGKLARFGLVDIAAAWCKSGSIRTSAPGRSGKPLGRGTVVVIDHSGHELYRKINPSCCGVLAIGDDTTAACGHICTHRGIPVLGITDGDRDSIVPDSFVPGSVVLHAGSGRDDDLGAEVAELVPDGPVIWDAWVTMVLDRLGGRVRVTLDLRDPAP